MAKLHLFAHMDRNYVKKGDEVKAYETKIGTVGKGNTNNYWAHLHHSISKELTPEQLIKYVRFWTKEKVARYYINPVTDGVDYDRMFYGRSMDVGNRGWGFLQKMGWRYYHPGQDINGKGGGDTDFGWKFMSPINGIVVYEWRGWTKNRGWGNLIIIQETEKDDKCKTLRAKVEKYEKKLKNAKKELEQCKQ